MIHSIAGYRTDSEGVISPRTRILSECMEASHRDGGSTLDSGAVG
ncbi:hypothetical protein SynBIOSE41_02829 [Synechococcus sp. BIOS-E4-1]|nr:hypothetical protein SynBIOSE41_02829 [Synechococcus sp. BIOS-E4-1]